jgi:hypothetical protein
LTSTRSSTLSTSGNSSNYSTDPASAGYVHLQVLPRFVGILFDWARPGGRQGGLASFIIPADLALRAPDSGRGSHRAPARQLAGASLGWKVSQLNRTSQGNHSNMNYKDRIRQLSLNVPSDIVSDLNQHLIREPANCNIKYFIEKD